jgi:outer membrane protein
MTLRRRFHGWLALATMLAAPAWAEPPPNMEPSPLDVPALHGRLSLSLEDAIKMGLENNLDVQVERYAPFIAAQVEREAWGAYDPEWFGNFNYGKDKSFVTSDLSASGGDPINELETTRGNTGFRGVIPLLGATYETKLDTGQGETNLTFQSLSPQYQSTVSIEGRVPLLKNLIWNEPWTRVKATRVRAEASNENFRTEVMNIVRDIVAGRPDAPVDRRGGYWNLIAAQDSVRVARKSLETAVALLDQTKTQYEVGVVSKVEVVEAEAGVAAREFDLIVAENRYRNAQDQLIDLVLGPHLAAGSTLEIDPTDRPEDYVKYEIDVELATERAFANRPELAVANKEIERREIELKFAKNQRLPQLDFVGGYNYPGVAGRPSPTALSPPNADLVGDYGHSYNDYFSSDGPNTFTVGAAVSFPIGNTTARSRATQAQIEVRRSLTSKRRLEQNIILEVRKAVRDLKSAQEGIEAAERRTVAASEQLRAEEIRLEYGESTPFDVLLRDRDRVDAESQEIVAFQTYRTSATGLDRAQGTILSSHNIEIDEVRELR